MSKIIIRSFCMLLAAFGLFFSFTSTVLASCTTNTSNQGRLHWSFEAAVTSPNGEWVVEVHPDYINDESPVMLRECISGKSWKILTLLRAAEVYWDSSSKHFLIIDERSPHAYRPLLFAVDQVSKKTNIESSSEIDETIRRILRKRLGAKHIEFYLPTVVSWKGENLVLAIGGTTTSPQGIGSMTPYCFGVRIDSHTRIVREVLSAKDVKKRFNNSTCKIMP